MKKLFSAFFLCLVGCVISARDINKSNYAYELDEFKNSTEHQVFFDDEIHPIALSIIKEIELSKRYTYGQRLSLYFFELLHPILVTPENMPTLYAFVDQLSKKAGIQTPTLFIASNKHDFFNAFAEKLFNSAGGILIGQELIYKTSEKELEAIIAHELGHIKHSHSNKTLGISFGSMIGAGILTALGLKIYRSYMGISNTPYSKNQKYLLYGIPAWAFFNASSFIINKRFEKEADMFALEQGYAEGVVDFFSNYIERMEQHDKDFDLAYEKIKQAKSELNDQDYAMLLQHFYIGKLCRRFEKFMLNIYHNTRYGAHPSPEYRVAAAQEYLALHQTDWNVTQG